ncbi:MAG: head GIN domain-containing protein [Acidobacteriota bacterium]
MKKIGIAIFVAALVVGLVVTNLFSFGSTSGRFFNFSMNFGGVRGSGNVATDKRGVSGFKSVDVGGVFQVEITAQKDFAVEVEADDNLLPLITTEVHDGVLTIETAERIKSSNPIRVRVYAPNIDSLEVSGVANVTVNDVKNSSLSLDSSGASKIKIAGETAKLTVETSGASKIDAEGLKAIDAAIDSSGASHVNLNVTGELRTDLSGASKVTYTGTPSNIVKSTSGASSVSQK